MVLKAATHRHADIIVNLTSQNSQRLAEGSPYKSFKRAISYGDEVALQPSHSSITAVWGVCKLRMAIITRGSPNVGIETLTGIHYLFGFGALING